MSTPLRNVRGLGSAKNGTAHFWRVRVTSVALLPLSLFIVGWILSLDGAGYDAVRTSLANPFVAMIVLAFFWSASTTCFWACRSSSRTTSTGKR